MKKTRLNETSDALLARLSLSENAGAKPASTSETGDTARPSRQSRNRAATRQKLIDAALAVVSSKGLEATTIADITQAADVGVGSFYNHFNSKDEIAIAVFLIRAEKLASINDEIAEREADPADVIVYILRIFLANVVSDPIWGWYLIRANNYLPETARIFMMRARRDVSRGIAEDRFTVAEDETAATMLMASMLAVMRLILQGRSKDSTADETIEYCMRMLGIDHQEARSLSRKPLPAYVMEALAT